MNSALPQYYRFLFKYRRWTAGLLATGLALNKGLPHFFPQALYLPVYADLDYKKNSLEQQLFLIKNTKKDLGIKEVVFPFITSKASCHCAGCFAFSKWKQRPVVGLPKYFFCNNVIEVEDLEIKLGNNLKAVDCNGGPNELAFLESLLFSESAKKFCIAQQLFALKGNWALWQIILSPLFVLIGYIATFHGLKLIFSTSKPTSFIKIIQFQLICIIATWIACRIAKVILNDLMIKSIDRQAAMVSEEYAAGGVEFCKNSRNTNKALRVLMGGKGEKMFTAFGNIKHGIIFNWEGPSLTEREKRFENILKSFENNL